MPTEYTDQSRPCQGNQCPGPWPCAWNKKSPVRRSDGARGSAAKPAAERLPAVATGTVAAEAAGAGLTLLGLVDPQVAAAKGLAV